MTFKKTTAKIHPEVAIALGKNADVSSSIKNILDNPRNITKADYDELTSIYQYGYETKNNNLIKSVVPNKIGDEGQKSFAVWIETNNVIGTKGETRIRIVYDELGNIWSVFPDKLK